MSSDSPKVDADQGVGENSNEFVVVGESGSNEEATQQQPIIHNFAAASYQPVDIHASPNFSFDSSPGLAIAEEDDEEQLRVESNPTEPNQEDQPVDPNVQENAEPQKEHESAEGSIGSLESAERSGFEVIRMQDLTLQKNEEQKVDEPESTNVPIQSDQQVDPHTDTQANIQSDPQPENRKEEPSTQVENRKEESQIRAWSDAGSPTLQIDEEAMESEPIAENPSNIENTTNHQPIPTSSTANQVLVNAYSDVDINPLLSQQRPSDEVMQLLNEQNARELHEKLEIEHRKQLASDAAEVLITSLASQIPNVENSKISVNALYSLNNGVNTISQLPQVAALVNPTPSQNVESAASIENQSLPKRREAYRWTSNLPIFAMGWSYKRYPNQRLRLACSSIRDGHELLKNTMSIVEFDEEHGELTERTQVFIGAPSCELKFIPTTDPSQPDLIASATRELRIYSYHSEQQEVVLEAKLCPNKSYAYAGPLTSVDWNEVDPRIIGGSSIDSTCTIWDIEAQAAISTIPPSAFGADQQRLKYSVQTQLIAHERPVHDMAFSRLGTGREYFGSCGADGSVRLFDLRNLKNSTILYEHPDKNKLNHISWNKVEPAQFVIVADSSNELVICDVRMPCRPLIKYGKHLKPVNSVDWAPHSPSHFCSGSSDHQALIWQLQGNGDEPLLAYRSEGEITRIRWSSTYNNWIGISFANFLEILRV